MRDDRPGDALLLFGLFVWVWVVVGPWYVGAGLLVAGTLLNYLWKRGPEP